MNGPTALGMVLAMLVDPKGKVIRGGAGKGQLYASRDGLVVLKPTAGQEIFQRLISGALFMSIVVVVVNVVTLKEPAALWIAVGLQAIYWFTLPVRRRALEPQPISADALAAASRAGRALVQIPSGSIVAAEAPEAARRGFRKPARFVLPDGALEMYLSQEQFHTAVLALGRGG